MKKIITGTLLAAAAVAVANPRSASPTPANSPALLILAGPANLAALDLLRAIGIQASGPRSLLGRDAERKEQEEKVAESFEAAPFEHMRLKKDSETETEKAIIQEAYEAYMRAVSYVCDCGKTNCGTIKNVIMQHRRNAFPSEYLRAQKTRDARKFKQEVNLTEFPNEPVRGVSHQERVAKETYQTHFAQPESHTAVALTSDAMHTQRTERATKQRMGH